MKIIEFKNVEKSFNDKKVINTLSFSINKNEIVALIGTNGAGKTTTIRLILGIIKPDNGIIKRFTKSVGAQLQATPFFEGFSVEDNLKFFSTFYQSDISDTKIDNILKNYNLSSVKTTPASKLSLGQQKRLAISITTLHDPEFIILDEPSSGLDPSGQKDVQNMIRELKRNGKSILFSSHDMLEVRNTADKILIMDQGKLLERGTPEDLLEKYGVLDLEELFYLLTKKENTYV